MRLFIGLILSLIITTSAQARDFGLGIVLGDPTGISFKNFFSSKRAIDGAAGWTDGRVNLHANYLWHKLDLFDIDGEPIDLHYGVGIRVKDRKKDNDENDLQLGIRGPIGINYMMNDPDIGFFFELAVVMNLTPDTNADLDFGLGARYFF